MLFISVRIEVIEFNKRNVVSERFLLESVDNEFDVFSVDDHFGLGHRGSIVLLLLLLVEVHLNSNLILIIFIYIYLYFIQNIIYQFNLI